MARTHKDKPVRLQYPEYYGDYDKLYYKVPGSWTRLQRAGVKPKKAKHTDKWHWFQSTPSWWTRLMMTKPKRRRCRMWEHQCRYAQDLSVADCPDWGDRPHVYYY